MNAPIHITHRTAIDACDIIRLLASYAEGANALVVDGDTLQRIRDVAQALKEGR